MSKTPPPNESLVAKKPRKLKASRYQSFKLQKKIAPAMPAMASAWRIFIESLSVLKRNRKLFLGITVVYGILTILLVRGLTFGANLGDIKESLGSSASGNPSQLVTGSALFVYLLSSSGNTSSGTAGVFQVLFTLIASLAVIWTLRQVYAKNKVRIRDGFYQGMYPLVPFLLICCVILLQLLPMLAGGFLYAIVGSNPTVTGVELFFWGIVFCALALVSLYMLTSSLFALYIVCLPDMPPLAALRSARELVRLRRWTVLRKVMFLPFILLVLAALIMLPLIMFAQVIAVYVFFVISMVGLLIVHSYMYRLYRELL
jgi:hypothetical protein